MLAWHAALPEQRLARLGHVDLLCINGLGYVELGRRDAKLLFQVLTEREEKASVAIASNESMGWLDRGIHHPLRCAAIVGRFAFGGNVIEARTGSCASRCR